MERHGVRGSVSLNVAMCEHCPEIIDACSKAGWEFYSHGTYNTRYTLGMSERQERELIQDFDRHDPRAPARNSMAGWRRR